MKRIVKANYVEAVALIRQLVPIIRAARTRCSLADTAYNKALKQAVDHYKRYRSISADRYGVPILVLPPTKAAIAKNKNLRATVGSRARTKRRLDTLYDKLLKSQDDLSWTRNNGYKITSAMLARAEARIAEWREFIAE